MKKLDRIAGEKIGLDVEGRPAEPHGPLKGPRVSAVVDDAVDVDVADITERLKLLCARYKDFLREFATANIPHDCARFAAVLAQITRKELLKLEILLEALREAGRAEPPAGGELNPLDRLLQ